MDTRLCDLRNTLRRATRCAHERTDNVYSRLDLTRREDGVTFLKAHYLAFHQVEARLAKAPELPAFPPRTGLIAADLMSMGVLPPLPRPLPIPDADALGFGYVVAGSHFGARQLFAEWQSTDDRLMRQATRYLSSPDLGTYWRALRDHLGAPFDPSAHESVVHGAVQCFQLFDDAFELAQEDKRS